MVKIRLTRIGRHEDPFYRIVAADSHFARDGRIIDLDMEEALSTTKTFEMDRYQILEALSSTKQMEL